MIEPSDQEVADELDMDISAYNKLLSNVQQRNLLSLDSPAYDQDSSSYYDTQIDPNSEVPDNNLEKKERTASIMKKIGELKERDRLILMLYYYEDMTMSEIALLLELTEARISQIVGKLLLQLRQELTKEEVVYVEH